MIRAFFFCLLSFASLSVFAAEDSCAAIAERANAPQSDFFPPVEAKVVGNGTLAFYQAPHTKCRIPKPHALPGQYLTVYAVRDGWANVMYIPKGGEDIVAWTPSARLKLVAPYGHVP